MVNICHAIKVIVDKGKVQVLFPCIPTRQYGRLQSRSYLVIREDPLPFSLYPAFIWAMQQSSLS